MSYQIKQTNIKNKNKNIYGELYIPKEKQFPLLIICHGLGGTHNGSKDIAISLVESGIGVFIFDFCGGSYDSKSSGKTTEMTVLTEAEDLEIVIDELLKCNRIIKSEIFLMGKSQGSYVSTLVASRKPKEIRGLIGLYSGFFLQDMAIEEMRKYEEIPSTIKILNLDVSDKYIKDLANTNIFDTMKKYSGDVLLIHGTMDSVAPISYAEKAIEYFPNAKLITIEGAEHGFHGPERESVIKEIHSFIKHSITDL